MKLDTDLRIHPRYKTEEAARLTGSEESEPVDVALVDISLGGCRVRTRRPLQVGMLMTIRLTGPLESIVPVEVRYSEQRDDEYVLGLRFKPSCHAERMSLAKAVFTVNQRHWAW
jgi:c-di-GMP-binding flagellar brake protein YcgR